jgi:hypothetical protein
VNVELDVLGLEMMSGVGGEVDSGDVVAVNNGGLVDGAGELEKKLAKPRALSDSVVHNPILSLSAGARDCGLPLGRLLDE